MHCCRSQLIGWDTRRVATELAAPASGKLPSARWCADTPSTVAVRYTRYQMDPASEEAFELHLMECRRCQEAVEKQSTSLITWSPSEELRVDGLLLSGAESLQR